MKNQHFVIFSNTFEEYEAFINEVYSIGQMNFLNQHLTKKT